GVFPCADQMIRIMQYYGFDGWFINIEELLPLTTTWIDVQQFMIYLVNNSRKVNPLAEIHWYDSNYVFGTGGYEEELNKKNVCMFQTSRTETAPGQVVSTGFFLDYAWSTSGLNTSIRTARQEERSITDIYAGIYLECLDFDYV